MAYLLHQLLSATAQRLPEHEAVRWQGASFTYAELDAQSNQLARALQAAGVLRPVAWLTFAATAAFGRW
jgi:non-ribosomal peptide synthetase component F